MHTGIGGKGRIKGKATGAGFWRIVIGIRVGQLDTLHDLRIGCHIYIYIYIYI